MTSPQTSEMARRLGGLALGVAVIAAALLPLFNAAARIIL